MIECDCSSPDVEFTLVEDEATGWILLQAMCCNCGKCSNGYGRSFDEAYSEVVKEWKKKKRNRKLIK